MGNQTKKTVTVNQVKSNIMFIKRRLHNHLVKNKLNHTTSTHTKPVVKGTITQQQSVNVKKQLTVYNNQMVSKYNPTTDEKTYINNQLTKHTENYLQPKSK